MNKILPFLTLLPLFGFWTKTVATMVELASGNKPLPVSLRAGVIAANNKNKKLKLDDVVQEGGAEKVQTASSVGQQHSFLINNKKENGESVHLSNGRHLQASRLNLPVRDNFSRNLGIYAGAFIRFLPLFSPEIGGVTHTRTVLSGFRGRNRLPRGAILTFRSTRPVSVSGIRSTLNFLDNYNNDEDPHSLTIRVIFTRGSLIGLGSNPSRRVRTFRVMARFNNGFLDTLPGF